MSAAPDANVIQEFLLRWRNGEIDSRQLQESMESVMESHDWPYFEHSDPRSVPMEVLTHLDALDAQMITIDDVPAILSFLTVGQREPLKAWTEWHRYWDSIDFSKREAEQAR
jgi:hypothetical protein